MDDEMQAARWMRTSKMRIDEKIQINKEMQ
jgi:hypothetical protein